jgi:predicted MPP superfamily phosphohydrolase
MPMAYKVRTATLPLLPKRASDIRILHFSDLHLTPNKKREIADIKSFIKLKPDLVISTGDFLAHKEAVNPVIDALQELLDCLVYLYLAQMITTHQSLKIHSPTYKKITESENLVTNCQLKNLEIIN